MVASVVSIAALCVCAALICKITEKYSKEQAVLLVIAVSAVIVANAVSGLPDITSKMSGIMDAAMLDSSYCEVLFKALGICYLTQFASDICRDCNETAIATAAEITGKIQLVLLSLPLFETLIDLTSVMLE